MSNIFNGLFDNLLNQVGNQTTNIQRLDEKLKEFAPGSGHGTVYSDEVLIRNAQYPEPKENVQESLDEIYALIGDIKNVLDSIT